MKRLMIILVALVLVIVLVVAGALLLVDANRFRPQIQASLSHAIGRPVTLGKLHVSVFSGSLSADDIRIGDDPGFGKQAFVSAKSLGVGVRLWPLIVRRALHVTSLTLAAPTVRLVQNRAGRWNFSSFASGGAKPAADSKAQASAGPDLTVDSLRIRDGRIVVERARGGTQTYDHVNLSADHIGMAHAFPFSLTADAAGGGSLKLQGTLGPWVAGNAIDTPVNAQLQMHGIDLVGAGLVPRSQGLGGVFDLVSQLRSRDGVLSSRGQINARKLKLVASGSPAPQTIRLDYQADYRLASGTGRIHDTHLGTGKASLAVDGSFDGRGKVMSLNMSVTGKNLPVDDLQPLLPAFGVVLPRNSRMSGGTLGVDLRAAGPLDALVIRGPVTLDNTRLAGFSLGRKLGGVLSLAGIPTPQDTVIDHARVSVRISPQGILADPASADIRDIGTVTGKGTMATGGALDVNMLLKLNPNLARQASASGLLSRSRAGRLIGGLLGDSSTRGIGLHITGTARDPVFRLDPSVVAGLLGRDKSRTISTPAPGGSARPASRPGDVLGNLLRDAVRKKPAGGGG